MTAQNNLHNLKLERTEGDAKLVAEISLCSFMYPHYGLQISVKLVNTGQDGIVANRMAMDTVTEADVQALFDTVKIHKCVQCDLPAFDRNTITANAEGLCWACITERSNREYQESSAEEEAELKRELKKMKRRGKSQGYSHLVTAMIHPTTGGDDYIKYFFTKGDDSKRIQSAIRKAGSAVTSDYRVDLL